MADGISTRLQREVGQHQKELERLESKLDSSVSQLRSDLDQLGSDMRRLFEQMMTKMEAGKTSAEIVEEGSRSKSGIETSQLNSGQSVVTMAISDDAKETNHRYCKHSRLECPKFEGDDFDGWLMKLAQYFKVEKIPNENKVRTVLMQLEGRTLHWHHFMPRLMAVCRLYDGFHI